VNTLDGGGKIGAVRITHNLYTLKLITHTD
jgi:hypothetical protein